LRLASWPERKLVAHAKHGGSLLVLSTLRIPL
jgi:hypothetical protein